MSARVPAPIVNRLLAALPDEDRERFLTHADAVTLVFSAILAEPDELVRHVYFPTGGFISMITSIDGRPRLEVGLIGDEGMLGASLILGIDQSPTHALVQGAGTALRMDAAEFRRQLELSTALRRVLMRYLHVMIQQLAQTAACTRFHVLEARLARWLLMTQDRAHSDALDITHEFLAYMLGVRRVGITSSASALQKRQLIRYRRGHITILDRRGLEEAACGCYSADRQMYARTMGPQGAQGAVLSTMCD